MKMKIFLSWSGQRSHGLAKALHDWLPRVINVIDPRFSEEFLKPGQMWSKSLANELDECSIGIFCLTPENLKSPWMLFEAGALSKGSKCRVCPLLWGLQPEALKGLPYEEFQALKSERSGVLKLVQDLNQMLNPAERLKDRLLEDAFETYWPKLDKAIRDLTFIKTPGDSPVLEDVLRALKACRIDHVIHTDYQFSNGFESPALYSAIANLAQKRLYIFGRKNRKIFDKGYKVFFDSLPKRFKNGFQLRVLFLDPLASEDILRNSQQIPDFKSELQKCITTAKKCLEQHGINASAHCRTYSIQRTGAIMVVDELVLHCPAVLDAKGRVKAFTNAPFSVFHADSPCGKEMLESFESLWKSAKPL